MGRPRGGVRGKDVAIEPDLSNAAPFLAAAVLTGGSVTVPGWPAHSTQPGALLADILPVMGAHASRRAGALTVTAGERIAGVDLDLSAASELTPTLFALAAFADAPTTFHGIGHIRGHETDRIAALVDNLRALGGEAKSGRTASTSSRGRYTAASGALTTTTASPPQAPSSG